MFRHALVLVSCAALVLASLVSACAGTAPTKTATPAATAGPTENASIATSKTPLVAPTSLPAGTIAVDLGGETNGVAVCGGSVWVAYYQGGDAIAQINPANGSVLGLVEGGLNLACFDGQPWAAVGTAIQHIDPKTRAVLASVDVRNAYYVGVGAGSVWTPSGTNIIRIDPATAKIVATIKIPAYSDATEVDGNDTAIWATVKGDGKAVRMDPATNAVVAEIPAGDFAHGILVQGDAIWISNGHENSVTRIDPATNTTTTIMGPGQGVGLAEGAGFVWASSRDGDLYRIDPKTSAAKVVGHVDGWPYGIGFLDGVLWVTDGNVAVFGIPVATFLPSS